MRPGTDAFGAEAFERGGFSAGAEAADGPRRRDVRLLAAALAFWAAGEGEEGMAAIAAAIRNRLDWARAYRRATGRPHLLYGDGSLIAVLASLGLTPPGPERAELCLLLADAALAGRLIDQTGGATQFHEHKQEPAWAQRAVPRAMVGSHVFYARAEEAAALYPVPGKAG